MEFTSFILGVLTVIAVTVVVVVVAGIVKVNKLTLESRDLRESFSWYNRDTQDTFRQVYESIGNKEDMIYRQLEEQKRELLSHIDSRIDKLQSRKELIK